MKDVDSIEDDLIKNHKLVLSDGLKFGGDLLGYPHSIEDYHAMYIIKKYDDPNQKIPPLDLIRLARLGTTTKKLVLLSSSDADKKPPIYLTCEWTKW